MNASYAAAVWVGVSLLSSLAWVLYGNSKSLSSSAPRDCSDLTLISTGHYAGPIKSTTKWTIGAEVDLPSSTSNGVGTRKKSNARAHVTTSAQHGRSAHVFAVSGEETEEPRTGEWTQDTRDVETGVTGTGSEYTEYTDDEEENDEDEVESRNEPRDGEPRSRETSRNASRNTLTSEKVIDHV